MKKNYKLMTEEGNIINITKKEAIRLMEEKITALDETTFKTSIFLDELKNTKKSRYLRVEELKLYVEITEESFQKLNAMGVIQCDDNLIYSKATFYIPIKKETNEI